MRARALLSTDAALAVAVTAAVIVELTASGAAVSATAAALLVGPPLAWRRQRPFAVLVVVLAGVSIQGLLEPQGEWVSPFAAVLIGLYSLAAYAGRRVALAGLATVLLFFASGAALDNLLDPGRRPIGDLVYMSVLNGSAWAVGRIVRRWREQALALEEKTAELERERAWREQAAAAEERTRIARELHDVIAHSVTLMVVQAAAAEQVMDTDPALAREAVGNVQAAGRQAVGELRRLLGILRPDEEPCDRAPQPTLRGLDETLERARDAGLQTSLEMTGAVRPLPAGVELTAYRLIQEALTNALKHAGPTTAQVRIQYLTDGLEIQVVNAAPRDGHAPPPNGTGHGLAGMRERLALYGGVLDAGPCQDGWAIRARIPVVEEQS